MYRYWDMHDIMGPYSIWWFVLECAAFIALVIFAVVLFRYYVKHTAPLQSPPTALDIARMRLAKGEITPEEFAAMKEHLK